MARIFVQTETATKSHLTVPVRSGSANSEHPTCGRGQQENTTSAIARTASGRCAADVCAATAITSATHKKYAAIRVCILACIGWKYHEIPDRAASLAPSPSPGRVLSRE